MRAHFLIYLCALILWAGPSMAKETFVGPVNAEVLRVIDGDTIDVRATIWIGQRIETRVRLSQIDTPELRGKCDQEKALAQKAKDTLKSYINGQKVVLKNVAYGKFAGRVLAEVETLKGDSLSDLLIKDGLARPYHGKKRTSWCH